MMTSMRKTLPRKMIPIVAGAAMLCTALSAHAAELPTHAELGKALKDIVKEKNGGFGLNMWATIVDRDGAVQAVTFSGKDRGDQWPGSRVISAVKGDRFIFQLAFGG